MAPLPGPGLTPTKGPTFRARRVSLSSNRETEAPAGQVTCPRSHTGGSRGEEREEGGATEQFRDLFKNTSG